jgi:tRNA/rRNA methyltransferase
MHPSPDPTRFVLMHTSHAGNVGAAARAMKVMGFSDLVLVQPRFADVLSREETVAMASGAADTLARARVVSTLGEALDGIHHVCATAMTPRDFGPPTHAPREHLQALRCSALRVAFVFGSERFGMSNDDVYRCHACLSIPTDARYGSLNLAQAVQLIAYEWRMALGGFAVEPRTPDPALADALAVQGALDHWAGALVHLGYLDEVHILRGIARAIEQQR